MKPSQNYVSDDAFALAMSAYDGQLAAWPVPFTRRNVATEIGETFTLEFGSPGAPPLVLLHGSASNSASWGYDVAEFAASFHCFAVDLPGETGRSTGVRPPYTGSAYPDWLSDVFDGLGLVRASICGLSLGGWVGLKFAAGHPERVEKLALLAPGGVAPARQSFVDQADASLPLGEPGIRELAAAIFAPQAPPPGVIEGFIFMQSIYQTRRDDLPLLTDSELEAIKAPVFLIGGARDAMLDMQGTDERLGRLLQNFESELDPNAGHALIGRGTAVTRFFEGEG
ncbi:MAG: alpha/beta hydrolase [bacterium]